MEKRRENATGCAVVDLQFKCPCSPCLLAAIPKPIERHKREEEVPGKEVEKELGTWDECFLAQYHLAKKEGCLWIGPGSKEKRRESSFSPFSKRQADGVRGGEQF